jgi:endonuclease/exonuclease/phosphatase family metal-dependent hydrolase
MALLSPQQKRIRRLGCAVFCLLAFILSWWGLNRLTAPLRAVSVVAGGTVAGQDQKPPTELRVAIWNIAHGRGLAETNWTGESREQRLERLRSIARALKSQQPDVVILNEVDFDASWSDRVNQAEVIALELGMANRVEGRNIDLSLPFLRLRFGNAILSRFPLSEAKALDFPSYSGLESFLAGKKRGLVCKLELPGKQHIRVLAVHLEHRSEAVRISSARIIERIRAESDLPLIAAGDFNSTPKSYPRATPGDGGQTAVSLLLEGKGFRAFIKATPTAADFTFRADEPTSAIDWVLAPVNWPIVEHKPLDSALSDHRPVVASLAIPASQ